MIPEWSPEAEEAFRLASKRRLVPDLAGGTVADRRRIEALLPHRDPFLFVHQVTHLDVAGRRIVGRFDLASARDVFAGHFPGMPVFPGALQIEAVGQVGLLWALLVGSESGGPPTAAPRVLLTHVLGARFFHPVVDEGEIEIAVQAIEDGLFTTAVGQIVHRGAICSAAGVSCLVDDPP